MLCALYSSIVFTNFSKYKWIIVVHDKTSGLLLKSRQTPLSTEEIARNILNENFQIMFSYPNSTSEQGLRHIFADPELILTAPPNFQAIYRNDIESHERKIMVGVFRLWTCQLLEVIVCVARFRIAFSFFPRF
jgi:hypothetical protein